MGINLAITDAIQKELPSAVASELQKYIEEAEKNKSSMGNLQDLNAKYFKELSDLRSNVDELTKLNLRKEGIDEQERNLKLEVANIKLVEAEKRAETIFVLVDRIFKNPVVTKTISGTTPVYVPTTGNGGSGYTTSVQTTETTTETTT